MLLSGHGKPSGGAQRFSGVRGAAIAGGGTAAEGSSSSRSGAASGRPSAVSQPLGGATEAGRDAGAEESPARRTATASAPRRLAADRESTEARPREAGLRDGPVDLVAGGGFDGARMRGEVPSRAGVADSAPVGMELPASGGRCAGTR